MDPPARPRAAFFDRDNTLIHDPGYLGDPAGVRLLPGAAAAVAHMARAGYLVVVISNQSGVARGFFGEDAVRAVNRRTAAALLEADAAAQVHAFYYCPHLGGCACRKPLPGLFLQAAAELHLDLTQSVALGDSERDISAALAAGCPRALRIGPPPLPAVLAAAQALTLPINPHGTKGPPPMNTLIETVQAALRLGVTLRQQLCDEQSAHIAAAAERIISALRSGGKLLLCGNGGSAADCQHIAAELTGRFSGAPRPALAALSLTTDTSALTAIANDFGYDQVFSRQVEALGRAGDVILCISTSGRSANILAAARSARERGVQVIALTGPSAGPLGELADLCICVPGRTTDRIQELHITVGHIVCDLIERALLP